MEWFYARGDMQRGPVSEDELADLIREGIIAPETRVWREGMEDWQPLEDLPELADRYLREGQGSTGESERQESIDKGEGKPSAVDVPQLPESVMRGHAPAPAGGMPSAYTTQAIVALVFGALCCTPIAGLAVVALVHGSKVKHLYAAGDYAGAQEASDKAKKWCNITALALIAAMILFAILMAVGALTEEP